MIPTGCERAFCHACNGSGYDCFDDRICDSCLGAGEVEICPDFQSLSFALRFTGALNRVSETGGDKGVFRGLGNG
jgi:DnaJ-class molecular chaperone